MSSEQIVYCRGRLPLPAFVGFGARYSYVSQPEVALIGCSLAEVDLCITLLQGRQLSYPRLGTLDDEVLTMSLPYLT